MTKVTTKSWICLKRKVKSNRISQKAYLFPHMQCSLIIALTAVGEHTVKYSMTKKLRVICGRKNCSDNTFYECFMLETFSMNILCAEMSKREQHGAEWLIQ